MYNLQLYPQDPSISKRHSAYLRARAVKEILTSKYWGLYYLSLINFLDYPTLEESCEAVLLDTLRELKQEDEDPLYLFNKCK